MTAQLLLINPNTSVSVTALLSQHLARFAPQLPFRAVTARFGPAYISDETGCTIAAAGVLDAWQQALDSPRPAPAAVLIGCFGDPGLLALRECSPVPVSGLAECAMQQAAQRGRLAIVTGGARWAPMLERLAHSLGLGSAFAGVQTVTATGAQLAADPVAAKTCLLQACRQAQQRWSPDSIIIGGAGLAGMAAQLQPDLEVELIDSVQAGADWGAAQMAGAGLSPPPSAERLAELRQALPAGLISRTC